MAILDTNGVRRLWQHVVAKLNGKVDKVDGKGLSTNDFTDAEKEKLNSLSKEVKDTDIKWTNNISVQDSLSTIEIAASNLHNANRFAFANIDGVKIEHSTDGGATFSEYSAGTYPQRKAKLISGITDGNGGNFRIGDPVSGTKATVNDQLRITLNATGMGIYTKINKLFLYVSTNGGLDCTVTVETAAYSTPDTYVNRGTYTLAGWPGWNSIPLYNNFRFNKNGSEVNIRLTFKIGALNSNTSYTNYLTVYNIVALGETVWASPSIMSKTGHLYDYDYQQNATFPANVTATKFIGDGSQLTNLPVSFTQSLTSGEKIGTININGTNTDIFAPEGSDGGNIYGVHDGEGNVTLMIGDAETEATTITPEIIGAADRNHTHNNMTGATTSKAGTSGFVPAPAAGTENRFLRSDGTWQEVTIPEGGGGGDYLPLAGGTVTGNVAITATTASTSTTTGALKVSGGVGVAGDVYANAVVGAVWNDYAETRRAYSEDFKHMKPGCVVTECAIENDTVRLTDKRLEKIPMVITDTYGFLIGEKEGDVVPVAVAGRVLVNTYEDRSKFELGDTVCSGPNGTVSIMTYEELLTFPDRVLGYVSCIPDYDTWGEVKVNNRIWIKLK